MRSYSHELAFLTHTAFVNYEHFRELGLCYSYSLMISTKTKNVRAPAKKPFVWTEASRSHKTALYRSTLIMGGRKNRGETKAGRTFWSCPRHQTLLSSLRSNVGATILLLPHEHHIQRRQSPVRRGNEKVRSFAPQRHCDHSPVCRRRRFLWFCVGAKTGGNPKGRAFDHSGRRDIPRCPIVQDRPCFRLDVLELGR